MNRTAEAPWRALRDQLEEALLALWHGEGGDGLREVAPAFLEGACSSLHFPSYQTMVERVRRAFPDGEVVVDRSVAAPHAIAHSYTFQGTHLGEFLGLDATGRRVSVSLMSFHELDRGRIRRSETAWDLAGLLAQVDALSLPTAADLSLGPPPRRETGAPPPPGGSMVPRASLGWPGPENPPDHELHPVEEALNGAMDDLWNKRCFDRIMRLHQPGNRVVGMLEDDRRGVDEEAYRAFHASFCRAFPDLQLHYVNSIGTDRYFAQLTRISGTHLGPFMGIPATGRSFMVTTMALNRIRDGKLAGAANFWDLVGQLEQLGVVQVDPFQDLRAE